MDLFRGTNLNLGFGTEKPYLIIGAPWLETNFLLKKLNEKNLGGVTHLRKLNIDLKVQQITTEYHFMMDSLAAV